MAIKLSRHDIDTRLMNSGSLLVNVKSAWSDGSPKRFRDNVRELREILAAAEAMFKDDVWLDCED